MVAEHGLDTRRLFSDESFTTSNGRTRVFTSRFFSRKFLHEVNHDVTPTVFGWAVYRKSVYNVFAVVAGKPGKWRLYYYHETKGWCSEPILIPRTAKYRVSKLVLENKT